VLIPDYPNFIAVWPVLNIFGGAFGISVGSLMMKIKSNVGTQQALKDIKGGEQFGAWVSKTKF
jgi:hypothetical protein